MPRRKIKMDDYLCKYDSNAEVKLKKRFRDLSKEKEMSNTAKIKEISRKIDNILEQRDVLISENELLKVKLKERDKELIDLKAISKLQDRKPKEIVKTIYKENTGFNKERLVKILESSLKISDVFFEGVSKEERQSALDEIIEEKSEPEPEKPEKTIAEAIANPSRENNIQEPFSSLGHEMGEVMFKKASQPQPTNPFVEDKPSSKDRFRKAREVLDEYKSKTSDEIEYEEPDSFMKRAMSGIQNPTFVVDGKIRKASQGKGKYRK